VHQAKQVVNGNSGMGDLTGQKELTGSNSKREGLNSCDVSLLDRDAIGGERDVTSVSIFICAWQWLLGQRQNLGV
jgi:hypothetical protein